MTDADGGQSQRAVRLQKFLSDAGVASRRHAEEMILDGRVLVNDQIVESLPAFIDPQRDRIIVDGAVVKPQPLEYWVLNKPPGVVCTNRDPAGRRRAVDFLPDIAARLFIVGRLDSESSGLVLLTNDGELALRITHPRYGIAKVYRVEVRGEAPHDLPQRLRQGVHLSEGKASASEVVLLHRSRDRSALEITLRESRNRQVRRMLARLGYKVLTLRRIRIGPLSVKGLPVGGCRRLFPDELGALQRAVRQAEERAAAARPSAALQGRPRFEKQRRLGSRAPAGSGAVRGGFGRSRTPQPSTPTSERAAATRRRIIR